MRRRCAAHARATLAITHKERIAAFACCSGSHQRGAGAGKSLPLSLLHPPAIGGAAILR
ncbi:hypothetical protein ACFOPN_16590 [Xanthomonas hyacinthi]|uniref:hypothetical protein n=1 Tax=Xanthomonas hyacinthi TaxID=56455 RepID=UPI00362449F2